jgi:Calcium-binding EGF domain
LQGREVKVNDQGLEVISQCFQLPFTIYDTNECTLPQGHDMRHQCQEPSICVNTIGSYECLCPRLDGSLPANVHVQEDSRSHTYSIDVAGEHEFPFFEGIFHDPRTAWELSIGAESASTCPSSASTRGCCPENAHSRDGQDCRKQFLCPIDPCSESTISSFAGNHSCAHNAKCVRRENPREKPNHSCICPDGLLGNGRVCRLNDAKPEPKVNFEGNPTEETIRNNYCGCTKPTIDACAGFPPCTSKY